MILTRDVDIFAFQCVRVLVQSTASCPDRNIFTEM